MQYHRMNNMVTIEYMLLPLVIISFLLILTPGIGDANQKIADSITQYAENISSGIPDEIKDPIENLSRDMEKYESLEDLEDAIDETINSSLIPNLSDSA